MNRRALALIATAAIFSGCRGSTGTVPGPMGADGAVRIFGDHPTEVKQGIASAMSRQETPLFITLFGQHHVYVFPMNAQIVRTANTVAVRSYFRVYVFDSKTTRIAMSQGKGLERISILSLPRVSAAEFDALGPQSQTKRTKRLCLDCLTVISSQTRYLRYLEAWHSDPNAWSSNELSALPIEEIPMDQTIKPDTGICPQHKKHRTHPGDSSSSCGSGSGGSSSLGSSSSIGGGSSIGGSCPVGQEQECLLNDCLNIAAQGNYNSWIAFCKTLPTKKQRGQCYSYGYESEVMKIGWCLSQFS
jgi:uncharacterized membrane protein YgcG